MCSSSSSSKLWVVGRKKGAVSQQLHSRTGSGRQSRRLSTSHSPIPDPSSSWAGSWNCFWSASALSCLHTGGSPAMASSSHHLLSKGVVHPHPGGQPAPGRTAGTSEGLGCVFSGQLALIYLSYAVIKPVWKFWPWFRANKLGGKQAVNCALPLLTSTGTRNPKPTQ